MKYTEFERKVEELGFTASICMGYMLVSEVDNQSGDVAYIDNDRMFCVDVGYNAFDELPYETQRKLFDLCNELAATPLEDRKPTKKYRLRSPMKSPGNVYLYINYFYKTEKYVLSSAVNMESLKTAFTEQEISDMEADFNLDFFIREEVSEDE